MDVHKWIGPVLKRFRSKRMAFFERRLAVVRSTRVLDVGGTPFNWAFSKAQPEVTLVNLEVDSVGSVGPRLRLVVADGRALPFRDGAFDVVFCNSVIEHVQPGTPRSQLAAEIERVGRSYFVETPNKWFPIEPHFLAPFFQFLPRTIRRRTARLLTPWGWITQPSARAAVALVDEITLLGPSDLRAHFAADEIVTERLLAMPKSLIAIKRR